MPVSELKARLSLEDLPAEARGRYNTLAGLLLYVFGRLPQTGEKILIGKWSFEIVDMDGRRIDKVIGANTEAGSAKVVQDRAGKFGNVTLGIHGKNSLGIDAELVQQWRSYRSYLS